MNLTLEYESFQDFANKLWPCLSEEGMWVRSEHPAAVGELVDFDVTLADGFRLFHGTGQVIAVGPGPKGGPDGDGMTLRFSQLDQPSRNLVRKVVSKHIGEGGKLFVLSTPGTKVEVVGDEEAAPSGGDQSQGMGPEDLVAPFAGLEGGEAWEGEAEPELTSFLRPSGKAADDSESEGSSLSLDFSAGFADPASEDATDTATEEDIEREIAGFSLEASGSSEPTEATPDEFTDASDIDAGADDPDGVAETPGARLWSSEPAESALPFDPISAETQRIDPLDSGGGDSPGFGPAAEDEGGVGPLPSTVVPPSLADADAAAETAFGDDIEAADEFDLDDDAVVPRERAWWPWVLVGGLAVGAGLYALMQMDLPLPSIFGGGATGQAAQERPAGPAAAPARGADATETEIAPAADAIDVVAQSDAASSTQESAAGAPDRTPPTAAEPVAVDPAANRPTERPARRADASPAPPAAASSEAVPQAASSNPQPDRPALEALQLQRITWRLVEGDTVIRLALAGPASDERLQTQRVTTGSPRAVLKVLGVRGSVPREPVPIGSDAVRRLRFGIHQAAGVRQVHVVADLTAAGVEMVGEPTVAGGAVEWRFRLAP